jgi:hypothetical protein
LVGVAVKVTLLPEQIEDEGDAEMLTLAITDGFTVIVVVELAGFPVMQLALDVISQVTVLPLARVASVYVLLLVPTLVPFFFHW